MARDVPNVVVSAVCGSNRAKRIPTQQSGWFKAKRAYRQKFFAMLYFRG
jgi:hypothetical protein